MTDYTQPKGSVSSVFDTDSVEIVYLTNQSFMLVRKNLIPGICGLTSTYPLSTKLPRRHAVGIVQALMNGNVLKADYLAKDVHTFQIEKC